MSMTSLLAYAYEAHAGDQLDGRTVVGVHDDGSTVTISFSSGQPATRPRLSEVTVQRELSMVATVMEERRQAQLVGLTGRYATEDDQPDPDDDDTLET